MGRVEAVQNQPSVGPQVTPGSPPGDAIPRQRRWDLMALHHADLVAYARRRGAGADAEDIAQEVLIRGVLASTLDEARPLLPYLLTIMANELRRRDRLAKRRGSAYRLAAPDLVGPGPEEEVVRHDLADREVARLWATESPLTAALVMRHAAGSRWPDLAIEFGLTEKAAEFRVRRALWRLRDWLRRSRPTAAA